MRQDMNWSRKKKVQTQNPGASPFVLTSVSNSIPNSVLNFATRAGAVLTSPYPSVDFLTRGFVRLR